MVARADISSPPFLSTVFFNPSGTLCCNTAGVFPFWRRDRQHFIDLCLLPSPSTFCMFCPKQHKDLTFGGLGFRPATRKNTVRAWLLFFFLYLFPGKCSEYPDEKDLSFLRLKTPHEGWKEQALFPIPDHYLRAGGFDFNVHPSFFFPCAPENIEIPGSYSYSSPFPSYRFFPALPE